MNTEFISLSAVSLLTEKVPCAIRLKAPATVERISTHFILLLDVSESMSDNNKLENVKKCSQLVLNFLTPEDTVSLITFGESAQLHLKRVSADDTHKQIIKSTIQNLSCDGCTNLSAGLAYIREVCEGSTQKTGLLVLTDGHANRGVHEPSSLRSIVSELRNSFTNLSIHCIAYGEDHNAELLKNIAEDNQGSYNIVNTIEDTAFAFGETLGGLMSCAFQNVKIIIPSNTTVHGTYKITEQEGKKTIHIGDVYSGTSPLILIDILSNELHNPQVITIEGMTLPDLKPFQHHPTLTNIQGRQIDIELTKLRYTCSEILKDIREWELLTEEKREEIPTRITAFETQIKDEYYNENQIAIMLRAEVSVLRTLYNRAKLNRIDHSERVVMTQHMTSIGLARGFSSPMAPSRHRLRRQNAGHFGSLVSNPRQGLLSVGTEPAENPDTDSENEDGQITPPTTAGFQNQVQMRVASLMRTASQQPQV
jgi:hypothetical protein